MDEAFAGAGKLYPWQQVNVAHRISGAVVVTVYALACDIFLKYRRFSFHSGHGTEPHNVSNTA